MDSRSGEDLAEHRGGSLVIAGEEQPPAVHALAHAMNAALGNVGKTVFYTDALEVNPVNEMESLRELVNDMNAGKVDLLLILGGNNPVYDAPVDFDFGPALLKVKTARSFRLYYDETAELCHWHVPAAHFLESWSDARAFDGTVGLDSAADCTAVRRAFGSRNPGGAYAETRESPGTISCGITGRASVRKKTRRSKRSGRRRCTTA